MVADSTRHGRPGAIPASSDDLIDEAGRESFPASDPPSTWSGITRADASGDGTDVRR
jgi:hypothetical protein